MTEKTINTYINMIDEYLEEGNINHNWEIMLIDIREMLCYKLRN